MRIKLRFDVMECIIYVPDGYVLNIRQLQADFFEWCETQTDSFSTAPGRKFAYSYSQELFLRYINEVVLSKSAEKAYFIDSDHTKQKKIPTIIF